jgi:hypothetical protein
MQEPGWRAPRRRPGVSGTGRGQHASHGTPVWGMTERRRSAQARHVPTGTEPPGMRRLFPVGAAVAAMPPSWLCHPTDRRGRARFRQCSRPLRKPKSRGRGQEPMTTLRQGSRGADVRRLQEALNRTLRPGPGLVIDGDYGPFTRMAVRRLQAANWLVEDGEAGLCTQNLVFGREVRAPILHPVALIPQPVPALCWAAATAMITRSTGAGGGRANAGRTDRRGRRAAHLRGRRRGDDGRCALRIRARFGAAAAGDGLDGLRHAHRAGERAADVRSALGCQGPCGGPAARGT